MQSESARLAGLQMDCVCGKTHQVPIRHIAVGPNALAQLPDMLAPFAGQPVFLAGDSNTMPLAEAPVLAILEAAGCPVTAHTFTSATHLITNEQLIGSMLIRMPSETKLLLVIGSGTLNDVARAVSARCHLPYIIIGTAPSMDGYASTVSAVVMDGTKRSVPLTVPHGIIADTVMLQTAPAVMFTAGVGDILGKFTALADWNLAARITDEHYCPEIAGMIRDAANRCVADIPRFAQRDAQAVQNMADTLILSGVAISMHGNSRPASGCEHQLAHHWEVELLHPAKEPPLHGNLVGFGTRVACRMYQLAGEDFDLPEAQGLPTPAIIRTQLQVLGNHAEAEVLGITRDMFYDSFFHATASNGRYTLLSWLEEQNALERYATRLTEEFLGA